MCDFIVVAYGTMFDTIRHDIKMNCLFSHCFALDFRLIDWLIGSETIALGLLELVCCFMQEWLFLSLYFCFAYEPYDIYDGYLSFFAASLAFVFPINKCAFLLLVHRPN